MNKCQTEELNPICISRGTTKDIEVEMPEDYLQNEDELIFYIKASTDPNARVLVKKVLKRNDPPIIQLTRNDTRLEYGIYYFDLWYVKADKSKVIPLCNPTKLEILEVVGDGS